MGATAGSVYQILRAQHVAGNPPDTDPQRASEDFDSYFVRMQGHALLPDINPTESDVDYLARLFSYQPLIALQNISASYAITSSNVTGDVNGGQYAYNSNFINSYSTSITCSNSDNGKFINLITGSKVYLTGSLSPTFATLIYQSGSGVVNITGSKAVLQNRQGFSNIAGQYGVISVVRVPNGDFVLAGDLA